MLQKLLYHKWNIFWLMLFMSSLILIRMYETAWFYDPFTTYFKNEFFEVHYPVYDPFKLYTHWFIRYILNTIISIGVIYVLFKDSSMIKITIVMYVLFCIILFTALSILLYYFDYTHAMTLFYVRRFVIQPLFLILFVPAFYYQTIQLKK